MRGRPLRWPRADPGKCLPLRLRSVQVPPTRSRVRIAGPTLRPLRRPLPVAPTPPLHPLSAPSRRTEQRSTAIENRRALRWFPIVRPASSNLQRAHWSRSAAGDSASDSGRATPRASAHQYPRQARGSRTVSRNRAAPGQTIAGRRRLQSIQSKGHTTTRPKRTPNQAAASAKQTRHSSASQATRAS